ncbi:MAG: hypothetical protein IPK59_00390 [Rhodospirillaceae bacterium]|nr:hypothetical protein [Rhodospirillaceae bacterium]
MSRLALIGVTGAAVVVLAAGLIYAIAQQEGDDAGDGGETPAAAAPGTEAVPAGSVATTETPAPAAPSNTIETASTAPGSTSVVDNAAAPTAGRRPRQASTWCASTRMATRSSPAGPSRAPR